ncbi:MAG: FAD-dependent oxidoreductase [bacterium]|nr:FAD-dependent oxidoreductase [bacterium]
MYDVVIVGGGIAAFSAGLYVARRGLQVLVIAKDIGGQANFTDVIENYPGIEHVGGYELASKIKTQAESYGLEFLSAQVTEIKESRGSFVLTAYKQQYKTSTVILAFGKTPRDLSVPGEEELKGRGVSYCATCDAPLFKNKVVTVAGVGDLNLEAALLCSRFAKKVYILSKTDKLLGHPVLLKAVKVKKNIELVPFIEILEIVGSEQVKSIRLKDLKTGSKRELVTDGIFIELGYVVESGFLNNLLKLDDQGQVEVNLDQSTSVKGIFACGDVTNRPYKQAVISAGDGASAGMAAANYLFKLQGGGAKTSDWTEIKKGRKL